MYTEARPKRKSNFIYTILLWVIMIGVVGLGIYQIVDFIQGESYSRKPKTTSAAATSSYGPAATDHV